MGNDQRTQRYRVRSGGGEVEACAMHDSSVLFHRRQMVRLRARLQDEGYLLLRGLLPAADVIKARAFIDEWMLMEASRLPDGDSDSDSKRVRLLGRQDCADAPSVRRCLEHTALQDFFAKLWQQGSSASLGEDQAIVTFAYKWLRAVSDNEFTGIHSDVVYIGESLPRTYTVWIPLGPVDVEQGSMMVLEGSNSREEYTSLRDTYGKTRVGSDGVESGWLSRDPQYVASHWGERRARWVTTHYQPGDVVVLDLQTVHMTIPNTSGTLRVSCDTRWSCIDVNTLDLGSIPFALRLPQGDKGGSDRGAPHATV